MSRIHRVMNKQNGDLKMELPGFPFISRAEWQARPSKAQISLELPLPYVVIHHTYIPAVCFSKEQGCELMRLMQNSHIDDRGWVDIGYNLAVGGDGTVFEGRGWRTLGSHAKNFNHISLGLCLIGDWRYSVPPPEQLKSVHSILKTGVELGYLKPDYKLIGHRQVRTTECPGDALFEHIKTWDHYSSYPASVADLVDIKEIPYEIRANLTNGAT